MDIGIEPTKKGYLLSIAILAIGGLIFYYLLLQNIYMITHLVDEVAPGESITIDVHRNEEFYILIDTLSRDYLSVYPLSSSTDISINHRGTIYVFNFLIYEEGNPSNTVVATELQGTNKFSSFHIWSRGSESLGYITKIRYYCFSSYWNTYFYN